MCSGAISPRCIMNKMNKRTNERTNERMNEWINWLINEVIGLGVVTIFFSCKGNIFVMAGSDFSQKMFW